MSPNKKATTVAGRYDQVLRYAHHDRLPLDAPRPLPTSSWPRENIALLERYRDWLLIVQGSFCKSAGVPQAW